MGCSCQQEWTHQNPGTFSDLKKVRKWATKWGQTGRKDKLNFQYQLILTILAKYVYFEASLKTYFCFSLSSLKLTKQPPGPQAPTIPVSASATRTFKGLSTTGKQLPGPRAPTIPASASATRTSKGLSFIFGHYLRSISVSSYFKKEALNLSIYFKNFIYSESIFVNDS